MKRSFPFPWSCSISVVLELFIRKYEGELRAEYEITEEVEQYYMPKLLLQPVVENCITHAFQENPENAVIRIEVKSEEGRFRFLSKITAWNEPKAAGRAGDGINRPEVDDKRIGDPEYPPADPAPVWNILRRGNHQRRGKRNLFYLVPAED